MSGGWTLIRDKVKEKLKTCKDIQYLVLLNLLDNYCPLVRSFYSITLKMNEFALYLTSVIYMWTIFVCFKRRHYNKSPLSFCGNYLQWKDTFPELAKAFEDSIATFVDECPVENTHSILMRSSKVIDSANMLISKI